MERARLGPAAHGVSAVVEDGVVEIEQDGAREARGMGLRR
jgi:hypothetical protein